MSRPTIQRTSASASSSAVSVGRDDAAVAHDGDPVGQSDDLLEPVRDIEDGDALRLELEDDAKSSSISASVSVAVGSSRITTLASMASALAISTICWWATVNVANGRRGRSRSPTRRSAAGVGNWSRRSTRPVPAGLASEEQVLADREVRRQRELLVHHRDAQRLRVRGRGNGRAGRRVRSSPSPAARPARAASSASTSRRHSRRPRRAPRRPPASKSTWSSAVAARKRFVIPRSPTMASLTACNRFLN